MSYAWRKLLSNPPPEWQRLPLITRGIGNEILRTLDASGEIDCGPEDAISVVCRITGAHPKERRRVREAIEELDREGFITIVSEGGRNFVRGHLPDLADARRRSASTAPQVRQPSASTALELPVSCASTAVEVRLDCASTALSLPTDRDNSAQLLNTGPVEEKREEEKREEEKRLREERVRAAAKVVGVDRPSPERRELVAAIAAAWSDRVKLVTDRPALGASAIAAIGRGAPSRAHATIAENLDSLAEWAEGQGPDPMAVVGRVLDGAAADSWLADKGLPLAAIAANPAKYAAIRGGYAQASTTHRVLTDEEFQAQMGADNG